MYSKWEIKSNYSMSSEFYQVHFRQNAESIGFPSVWYIIILNVQYDNTLGKMHLFC